MPIEDIRVGRTHTDQLLFAACGVCGIAHPELGSSEACVGLRDASDPQAEQVAWRALKAAVAATNATAMTRS